MSDYPKYRLKKDTPEFEAGQMFTRGRDEYDNDCLFAGGAPLAAFDVSLIDNFDEWFEEVKEPVWVRKQIKQINIAAPDKKNSHGDKYTNVNYRFIKPFYMNFKPDEACYLNKVALINQLVRDGYIEIEDNPNIVWEDEND